MSIRSVILGLSLGLFIAAATFFNDFVVRQTMLVASHLPIAVFGLVVLVVLMVNPLLRLLGRGVPLRPAEIAVTTAVALAACGWPGSGFWRYAVTIPAMPGHWARGTPSWQANNVMSYVPGGPGTLAAGHLLDPTALARQLVAAAAAESDDADPVAAQLWAAMPSHDQATLRAYAQLDPLDQEQVRTLLAMLNTQLLRHDLFNVERLPADVRPAGPPTTLPDDADAHDVSRWNRTILARAYPELVLPLARGHGMLVDGGRVREHVVDLLITGRPGEALMAPEVVPWRVWWPTLRLWCGVALALGLASLCVALIVHPQWSQRELLPYPIARLVEEIGARREGAVLPDIARSQLFWLAMAAVIAIHSVNGLHAWFPEVPTVPLRLDFTGFRTLFPNAYRVPHQNGVFSPTIYFAVVGFAFFVPTSASLSLGLAPAVWVAFGAVMLTQGIAMDYSKHEPSRSNFLRFGAFLCMALIIVYTGRRYYWNVLRGSLGALRAPDTPRYAIWAARALVPLLAIAAGLLYSAGMDLWVAALVIAITMLAWVVLNRIVCETGAVFITNAFIVSVIVEGLVGFDALGPSGLMLVIMTSWMIIADPRESVMPYLGNGLAIVERAGGGRTAVGRVVPWLAVMLVASMIVAGFVTLSLQYERGVTSMANDYAARFIPSLPFDRVAFHTAEAAAVGALTDATAPTGLARLASIDPVPGVWTWFAFGFVLVLLTAIARLRLPNFPLHPVLFLVWGTYAIGHMGFSFLLGCIVKSSVTRIGGTQAYLTTKPLMVGLIAGELIVALIWMVVGAIYFLNHGTPPPSFSIFPG